jgi:hypothetical protein
MPIIHGNTIFIQPNTATANRLRKTYRIQDPHLAVICERILLEIPANKICCTPAGLASLSARAVELNVEAFSRLRYFKVGGDEREVLFRQMMGTLRPFNVALRDAFQAHLIGGLNEVQDMRCICLFEYRTKETTTRLRVRLKVQYHVIARLQELRGERPDYGFKFRGEVNVVVKGLHLIAKQPHHAYVFRYQYCRVLLGENICDGRLSRASFAAHKVKGWCEGHEPIREGIRET